MKSFGTDNMRIEKKNQQNYVRNGKIQLSCKFQDKTYHKKCSRVFLAFMVFVYLFRIQELQV